jgi:hypothetical protein
MKDLCSKQYKLKDDMSYMFGLFSGYRRLIHDGAMPLNEVYWTFNKNIDDKCINMIGLRYIEYVEIINESVRPFTKD